LEVIGRREFEKFQIMNNEKSDERYSLHQKVWSKKRNQIGVEMRVLAQPDIMILKEAEFYLTKEILKLKCKQGVVPSVNSLSKSRKVGVSIACCSKKHLCAE